MNEHKGVVTRFANRQLPRISFFFKHVINFAADAMKWWRPCCRLRLFPVTLFCYSFGEELRFVFNFFKQSLRHYFLQTEICFLFGFHDGKRKDTEDNRHQVLSPFIPLFFCLLISFYHGGLDSIQRSRVSNYDRRTCNRHFCYSLPDRLDFCAQFAVWLSARTRIDFFFFVVFHLSAAQFFFKDLTTISLSYLPLDGRTYGQNSVSSSISDDHERAFLFRFEKQKIGWKCFEINNSGKSGPTISCLLARHQSDRWIETAREMYLETSGPCSGTVLLPEGDMAIVISTVINTINTSNNNSQSTKKKDGPFLVSRWFHYS